jgi:hypothetical protein
VKVVNVSHKNLEHLKIKNQQPKAMNESLVIIRHHCEVIFQAIEKIESTIQQLPEADRKIIQQAIQMDKNSIDSRVVTPDPNLMMSPSYRDIEDKTSDDIELDDSVSNQSCGEKNEQYQVTQPDDAALGATNEDEYFPLLEGFHLERGESHFDQRKGDASFANTDSSFTTAEMDAEVSNELTNTTVMRIPSEDRMSTSYTSIAPRIVITPSEFPTTINLIHEVPMITSIPAEFPTITRIPNSQTILNFDMIQEEEVKIGDESLDDDNFLDGDDKEDEDDLYPKYAKRERLSTKPKRRVTRVYRSPKKWRRLILNHRLKSIFINEK